MALSNDRIAMTVLLVFAAISVSGESDAYPHGQRSIVLAQVDEVDCKIKPPPKECEGIGGTSYTDPMAGTYGNTVVVTNAKGESTKLRINKDGTYTLETAKGEKGTGRWSLKESNTKYCSTPDLPASAPKDTPAPKESCTEFKGAQKVGNKWEQNDADGQRVVVEIVAGS